MEESQKRASTSPTLKEKASLLADGEIGKDFLSSWKSMSVTENDTMDFDFGTVAKGKKKTFNFDNLDVDFSLDGDFDKISSFKVDMSDIDISSPAKKSGKPRERTKEEAAGGNQGKQDRFSFPFDFNDLDSFSFEPSLMKEGKKCNKTQVSKVSLNGSESQGSGGPLTDDVGVLEDVVMSKLPASKCVTISNTRTIVDAHEDLDPMNENSLSKSVINENHTAKSTTSRNLIASQRARTWPQNTVTAVTQEHYQESHRPDQGISTEPYVCETIQPIQDLSVQSGSENESVHDTTSDINGEVCSLAPKVIPNSGGEQNNNVKAIAGLASESGNSPGNNCETNKFGSQNHVSGGNTDDSEAAQSDSHFEYNCSTSFSRESLKDMKTKGVNLNSTSKLLSAPLSSGTSVDKLRGTEEKVSGIIRSKFFNRSNETKSQAQHALLTQTKLTSFVSKGIGMQRPTDERREDTNAKDAQCGSKLSGSLRSYSGDGDKTEPLQPGSGRNVVALKINRGECMNADVAQSGSKGTGYSRPQEIKVSKAEPVLQGSGNSNNELHTFSSTEQMNKYVPQNSVNPRLTGSSMASAKNMNNISVEGNKISPLTFGRGKTDLSSLKISRTNGPNEGPSKSTFLGDIKSGRSTEQKRELHGNTASKLAHSLGTEMKTPPTPSLKRKTFEASNVDMLTIKPAKRLSESPTESRIREPSERVGDEKTPTLHFPREMNMTEPDTHLVMENDGSIERAEACTKELEDICNMLKKKHEEAKEILVRAIVNNNTLLILNHPICEEKIRMVQKFAAQLMSKELRT